MQLQFFIALKALWHLVNGSHLEWVEWRKNQIGFVFLIKLMQLQVKIAFQASRHSMSDSHLESMGCQLFMKKNRIDFFLLVSNYCNCNSRAWWHSMNGCNLEFWNEHTHRHIHRHEHGVLLHIDIHGFLLLINIAFCYMDVDVQF